MKGEKKIKFSKEVDENEILGKNYKYMQRKIINTYRVVKLSFKDKKSVGVFKNFYSKFIHAI